MTSVLRRLGRAIERTNFTRADALWREIAELYPNLEEKGSHVQHGSGEVSATSMETREWSTEVPSQVPMKVYNFFLLAFMTLRRSSKAIEVWNHMVLSGRQPENATWTAMLNGCRLARDPRSIEILWAKMRAAGVKPDVQSWTTRIGGLIRSGKWDLGIRALDEMGTIWKETTRTARMRGYLPAEHEGDFQGVVKPTIATINEVLAGLIKIGKGNLTPRILSWANDFGLEPDLVTFNTLLGLALRKGRSEEAGRLLEQMEKLKIRPDVVTFTIILDGLFREDALVSGKQPATDQGAAVTAVLTQMEESGVEANVFSYGTIIDHLLKSSTPNLPAARAVMDHMASRNITPSPHIYTILLTHYFSQDPPDLAALDVLWNRIRLERGVVDHIFYDRMVEGYGKAGEFGKMMAFFRRMVKEGKAPGWDALVIVLKAIIQVEDWDMANDLVHDVEREGGLFYAGIRGRKGEDEFKSLVQGLREQGLIGSEGSVHNVEARATEVPMTY